MQEPDATALRFLVGHALKTARLNSRATQAAAAKVIGRTSAMVSYLESGSTEQRADLVAKLMEFYNSPDEDIEWTVNLAGRADHAVLSARNSEVWPTWFRLFPGLEALAAGEFEYQTSVVPGQLQTEAYANGLMADSLHIPTVNTVAVVQARMARQRIASPENPLNLQAVVEESVLDRPIGGREVMIEQLDHLLEMMARPNVDLRVVQTSVGAHEGLLGAFIVLTFAEARALAYAESHIGAVYQQDKADVDLYQLTAARLTRRALSAEESAEMITQRRKNLEQRK